MADEWAADYPSLIDFAALLRGQPKQFPADDLSDDLITSFCLELAIEPARCRSDVLAAIAVQVAEMQASADDFRKVVLQVFFRVGLVFKTAAGRTNYIHWGAQTDRGKVRDFE